MGGGRTGGPPRADEAHGIYHRLNRGHRREPLFLKTEDFEAFERLMVERIERSRIKLYAYCLMSHPWHMVVSPEVDGEMGRLVTCSLKSTPGNASVRGRNLLRWATLACARQWKTI